MQTTAYVLQAIFHKINLTRFENAEHSNHFLTTIHTDSTLLETRYSIPPTKYNKEQRDKLMVGQPRGVVFKVLEGEV